jgi:hypothetical protein
MSLRRPTIRETEIRSGGGDMAKEEVQHQPSKVGARKSAQARPKESSGDTRAEEFLDQEKEESEEPTGEGVEEDVALAKRKGQSGKKGRPLPSREVAVKRPARRRKRTTK